MCRTYRFAERRSTVDEQLFELVRAKDYIVLTSNVDEMFARHGFEPIRVCSIQGDYANLQWVPPCSSAVWPTHPVHSCRASAGEIERLNNLAPAALASGTTKATWPSATADYGTAVPDTGDNGQTTETGGPWPREAAGHMGKCPGSVAIVIQRNSVNSETPAKPLAPLVDPHIEGRIPAAPDEPQPA